MKKGEHPEIDAYVKQLGGDKRLYELPSVEDARAYARMRLVQLRKSLPTLTSAASAAPTTSAKRSREEIVVEAYIQTFCHRKRLAPKDPKQPVTLDAPSRTLAYKLYVAGVLPVRLGGVNL